MFYTILLLPSAILGHKMFTAMNKPHLLAKDLTHLCVINYFRWRKGDQRLGGQSGTGTVCLRILWFSPVSIILPRRHTHLHLNTLLSEGQAGEARKSSKKQCAFGHQRALDTKTLSMDGSMDGWIDGWMDGWMNGWMDEVTVGSLPRI